MKTFCVPSRKSICPTPLLHQGVMLTTNMLQLGIWFPVGGRTILKEDEYRKEFDLRRSENEPEYKAALSALLEIHRDNQHFLAVISMRWCSLTYRLVTAKRVWLGIYYGERTLLTYSHKNDGRPTYNFCECWETPERDQKVWEDRFNDAILAALK